MAKSCQIIRDYNNTIQRVTDVRGEDSRLYNEALNLTQDPEEALKIWSVAQTDEFRNSLNYQITDESITGSIDRRRWNPSRGNQTLDGAPINNTPTLQQITDRLQQTGLASNVTITSPQQIEQELVKRGIDASVAKQVSVWHGSPHLFDKFSLSAIGTGEGAQAFGYGLYFTDLESIAMNYAKSLTSSKKYSFEGIDDIDNVAVHPMTKVFLKDMLKTNPSSREDAARWVEKNSKGKSEKVLTELMSFAKILNIDESVNRNLYKVTLHKGKQPSDYTWLEWDKKIPSILEKKLTSLIQKSFEFTSSEKDSLLPIESFDSASGFYSRLSDFIGQKDASLFLLENGIDGIKYPAESIARGATSDTTRGFNYVVFDETAITTEEVIQFQKSGIGVLPNGFVDLKTKEVFINEATAAADTPVHEFSHLFNNLLKQTNPQLYQKGLDLIEKEGKEYIDFVKENQPELNGEALLEEALAQAVGEAGARIINKQSGLYQWLEDMWNSIKGMLGLTQYSWNEVKDMNLQQFTEAMAVDLLRGETIEAQEYFTRNADRLPLTLSVFNRPEFKNLQGKTVNPITILNSLNQTGIKQIEKDIIKNIIEQNYQGQKKISYDELEATVRANIMPLERIFTSSYADYGMNNLGDGNYGEANTIILNAPIEHGVTGHFSGDFKASGRKNIKYVPKQLNDNTWVAVEEGYESQANNNNIYQFVGTAGTKESVDAWIENYEKPLDRGIKKGRKVYYRESENSTILFGTIKEIDSKSFTVENNNTKKDITLPINLLHKATEYTENDNINKGMFGHIRVWQDGDITYISELQSDYFQKNNARKNILESRKDYKEAFDKKQKEEGYILQERDIYLKDEVHNDLLKIIEKNDRVNVKSHRLELYDGSFGEEALWLFIDDKPVLVSKHPTEGYSEEMQRVGLLKGTNNLTTLKETLGDDFVNNLQKEYDLKLKTFTDRVSKVNKEFEKTVQEITNKLSPQEKQFIASQKEWEKRMVREAIKEAALSGATSLRFPTPYTLSVIEGYVSEDGNLPYEIYSASDESQLSIGDEIYYAGDKHTVISADSTSILAVESSKVYSANIDDFIAEGIDLRTQETMHNELGFETQNAFYTLEEWEDVRNSNSTYYLFQDTNLEDIADEKDGGVYEINEERVEEMVREAYEDSYSDISEMLRDMGYDNVYTNGDTVYYTEWRANAETFGQPDTYDRSSKDDFSIEDNLDETQQTVARKYEEIARILESERGDNLEVVTDENGFDWYETKIEEQEINRPVVAFQTIGRDSAEVTLYHGGTVTDTQSLVSNAPLYMARTEGEAIKYSEESGGSVFSVKTTLDKIADESVAREILETMGYPQDEWMLHELIDPSFEESYIGDHYVNKLYSELRKRGMEGIQFSDIEVNNGNRTVSNIVLIDPQTSLANKPTDAYYYVGEYEANNLFQQGYKPLVNGVLLENITQEGLDNLFETNDKVRMKLPPQTEPLLKEVLDFLRNYNNQEKRLSPAQHLGLVNNSMTLPVSNVDEINSQLSKLYVDGVFTINASTLRRTGLYTENEVQHILSSEQAQQQIKEVADALQGEVSLNNEDTNIELATYQSPELIEVFNGDITVGIGKFEQVNPFEIDAQLRAAVGGIKDRNEFERLLVSQNETILGRYYTDDNYADKLFNTYSAMDRMSVMQDTEDGIGYMTEIEAMTREALIIGEDNAELIGTLDFLRGIPKPVWDTSGIEVEDMLMRLEDLATERGIDLVGISEMEYSFEDGLALLDSVRALAQAAQNNRVSDTELQDFYDNYNNVFKKATEQPVTAQMVAPQNRGKKLVKLDTNKTEQELFDNHSLLRTQDANVYHRINKIDDLDRLYDQVTDMVMFNPNIIDKMALYPSAYNGNKFSLTKATDEANRDSIREDIERWAKQQPYSEELTLYKVAFGHPVTFTAPKKNISAEYHRQKNITNTGYLQNDYIADFAKLQLEEKAKGSDLYNNVLKHFGFSDKGIVLKNDNPYVRQQINIMLPTKGVSAKLRDYVAISKDPSLNTLFPFEQPFEEVTIQFKREFYANNPEQLTEKSLLSKQVGPHIGVQNAQDDWIKVNGQVAEKIRTYKNVSIYQVLPVVENPNFYSKIDFKVQEPNIDDFKSLIKTSDDMTSNRKYYKENDTTDKQCTI